MNIVLVPGICFARDRRNKIVSFVDALKSCVDCDIDVLWFRNDQYKSNKGLDARGPLKLKNKEKREFLCELSFDIHYVMKNFKTIEPPPADIYIGHSAGSLLTMLWGKPCITMGNPSSIIDMFHGSEDFDLFKSDSFATNPILNIVNKLDVAAYPFELPNIPVENVVFSSNVLCRNNFKEIHESYYGSKKVIRTLEKKLK